MMKFDHVEAAFGNFHLKVDATLAGGATGIFGVSGAGKTTLLEIIAGLKTPTRGRLTFNDRILFDCGQKMFITPRDRRIGYVPQDLALFPHMTVEQNIRYGQVSSNDSPRSSFETICEILELGNKLDLYPGSLSGGEEQRVAFARALMIQPTCLLLDEPLRGLHDALKEKIISYLLTIRDEFVLPMMYVTHAPSEIMALCQHVLILDKGTVIGEGKPSDHFVETTTVTYNLKSAQGVSDEFASPERRVNSLK